MLKAYDIINNALQITGAIAYGEQIEPALGKTALQILNGMRAEWSGTLIDNQTFDETFQAPVAMEYITLGQYLDPSLYWKYDLPYYDAGYTQPVELTPQLNYSWSISDQCVLVKGNFPNKPNLITEVTCKYANVNKMLPIKTIGEYRSIAFPYIVSIPSACFIDNNYPIQKLYLYPWMAQGMSIRVIAKDYLREYVSISDNYVDLPELFNAQVLNLAIRLFPFIGKDVPQYLQMQAASSLKHLKNRNFIRGMEGSGTRLPVGFNMWGGFN